MVLKQSGHLWVRAFPTCHDVSCRMCMLNRYVERLRGSATDFFAERYSRLFEMPLLIQQVNTSLDIEHMKRSTNLVDNWDDVNLALPDRGASNRTCDACIPRMACTACTACV